MTTQFTNPSRATQPVLVDPVDSLQVRLIVAGRLSPTALDIHRNRAELAAIVGHPRSSAETATEPVRTSATPS
jgi:hypothetical protein